LHKFVFVLVVVLVLVLVIEKRRLKHEEKRIEDEYDDDIIADRVLQASNRRGERWIALLVNFRSNIKISIVLSSVRFFNPER
jgi:Tfp pilus assembly protein PilX